MSRSKKKPKRTTVAVTVDDLFAMKRFTPGLSPAGVKTAAKARAAGREVVCECGSTVVALKAMTSAIPHEEVAQFCRDVLRAA